MSGAPGLLSQTAGWCLPGLPRYDAPPRPQPAHAAPRLNPEEYAALHGDVRSCEDGHDVVTWQGPDPCWACPPEPAEAP